MLILGCAVSVVDLLNMGEQTETFYEGPFMVNEMCIRDRYGYGCDLDYADGIYSIVTKDGVRTRLTLYNKEKFAVQLDKTRYTKAGIADDLSSIALTLENVTEKEHAPEITISRLPAGEYEVVADKKVIQSFSSDGTEAVFTLELSADKEQDILIQTKQSAAPADKTKLETAVNLAKETAAQTEKYTRCV